MCIPAEHPRRLDTLYVNHLQGSKKVGCTVYDSTFEVVGNNCDGREVLRWGVGCWWGLGRAGENCGRVIRRDLGGVVGDGSKVRWYGKGMGGLEEVEEEVGIVVPAYAWTHNIYHYARQWIGIWRVVKRLDKFGVGSRGKGKKLRVRVLFKQIGVWGWKWHRGFREMIVKMMELEVGRGMVMVDWLFEDDEKKLLCVDKAIVLGAEGSAEAFMFLNDSEVKRSPPGIPGEAIMFKEEVNNLLGLRSKVRYDEGSGIVKEIRCPGRVVGYLVRVAKDKGDNRTDVRKDIREFRAEDETWFRALLERMTSKYNLKLKIVNWDENEDNPRNMSFTEQVMLAQSLGGAVGIHGANLVNTIFMPMAGALFEIMPYHYPKAYYYAGSNSGLRYSSHAILQGKDHDCSKHVWCHLPYRDTEIQLGEADKIAVEKQVEEMCEYLDKVAANHPSGWMPVQEKEDGTFEVKGFEFRESRVAVDHWKIV